MGRPKGSKNTKNTKKTKIHPIKKNEYLNLTEKTDVVERTRYQKFLDKFDDWTSTVWVVTWVTIIVFSILMVITIKLLF